jgi:hypothetical protein
MDPCLQSGDTSVCCFDAREFVASLGTQQSLLSSATLKWHTWDEIFQGHGGTAYRDVDIKVLGRYARNIFCQVLTSSNTPCSALEDLCRTDIDSTPFPSRPHVAEQP